MDPATKRYIDDRFSAMKREMLREITSIIDTKIAFIDRRVEATAERTVEAAVAKNNGGGAGASGTNDKQLALINKTINMRVSECIREDVKPQLDQLRRFMEYKTTDESELVTAYRKGLYADDDVKRITSGNEKTTFQSSIFAFTDDD